MALKSLAAGDRVAFLDEVGGGTVLGMLGTGHVRVRTDDGFELDLSVRSVVRITGEQRSKLTRISDHQAGMVAANDVLEEQREKRRATARPGKTPKRPEDAGVAQVDLHLQELVKDESMLTDGEKLEFQVRYFERALETAIRTGKRKLIVIHGIGEGVLREEVRRILQFYDNVQFHDADMRRYGSGATEVIILRQR